MCIVFLDRSVTMWTFPNRLPWNGNRKDPQKRTETHQTQMTLQSDGHFGFLDCVNILILVPK